MESVLSLKSVSFAAQNALVVEEANLEIEAGKTTAFVGPSGGGKSTLLKLSAGLLIPSGGEVLYQGRDIALMNRLQNLEFRRESAFVFQDSALWANQSLFQTLELPLRIHFPQMSRVERQRRIEDVMSAVGYKRSLAVRPANLSMGEQKLIAFGRAMLCGPKLLFLDEWTESLDDNAAQRLIALVKQQQSRNNTVVFVSHKPQIIRELADCAVMVAGGRIRGRLAGDQLKTGGDLLDLLERDPAEKDGEG
ncbi:MAG: ATP-binding cassette domain-containing protein [Treponema sp.]|jgi:ABC-type lipoprotein export system ATPase subunit|nr:ATP-binding cassette domain-containing protein [Treponema sp.]